MSVFDRFAPNEEGVDGRLTRRQCLGGLVGACCGLAGCTADGPGAGGSIVVDERSCADGVVVSEADAQLGIGTTPSVRFRIENGGSEPIAYRLVVVFFQGTSTGKHVRSGRALHTGTLAAGETTQLESAAEGPDSQQSTRYEAEVSISCVRE